MIVNILKLMDPVKNAPTIIKLTLVRKTVSDQNAINAKRLLRMDHAVTAMMTKEQ